MSPRSRVAPRSAAILAALVLLALAFAPAQYFGRQQDDLLYAIGARALLAGRYCLTTSPGCPPLTMINPAWPALLTIPAALSEGPGPMQALSALLLAAVPVALWAWLRRRRLDESESLLCAALLASSPLLLEQSGVVMSEPLFALATIGLLAAAESGAAAAAGGLGALVLMTRTAGLPLIPAALVPFARARGKSRVKNLALAAVPPALAWLAWAAWSRAAGGSVGKFDLLPATYGGAGAVRALGVAAANARFYAASWGGCFLPPTLAGGALATALGAALWAGAAFGAARALRRDASDQAGWALAGSAALYAAWGWQYERYMIALLPLLLPAFAGGLGRAAKPALGALLALQLVAQTLPRLGKPSPWAEPELARTYAWLSARPRPTLLVSLQPVRDGVLSGLPGASMPLAPDAESFAAALKSRRSALVLFADGQDYGLDADPDSAIRRRVETIRGWLGDARLFEKVHEEPAERASVYAPR